MELREVGGQPRWNNSQKYPEHWKCQPSFTHPHIHFQWQAWLHNLTQSKCHPEHFLSWIPVFIFTSTTMSWPVTLGMQTLKPHVCNEETSFWRAWKSNQLIQPRELTEAGEGHYIPTLLVTDSVSSKIGRTEHFLLFHTHLLTHGYQPTLRKGCKAQRGAELPALGTPWTVLSRHGLPHPLKPKCAAKTGEGTNTFQDIISTMLMVVQLPRAKKNATDTIIPKYTHIMQPH